MAYATIRGPKEKFGLEIRRVVDKWRHKVVDDQLTYKESIGELESVIRELLQECEIQPANSQ